VRRIFPLAASAIVLAGALAGGPYLAGLKAEKVLRERLADQALGSIRVREHTYERGWWTSMLHARLAIGAGPAFDVALAVRHGPVNYRALARGRWAEVFVLAAMETAEPFPGAVRATFDLHGAAHGVAGIRNGSFSTAPEVKLSVGALDASFHCPPDDSPCAGQADARELRLTGNAGFLAARELGLRIKISTPGAETRHLRVGGLEYVRKDPQSAPIRAGELRMDYDSAISGGLLNAAVAIRAEQLQVAQASMRSVLLEAALERVAVDALPEARMAMARYALARGQKARETRAMLALYQAAGPLLRTRPQVRITRFALVSGSSTARGSARLGVRAVPLADDPASLLTALDGELALSLPAEMLEDAFAGRVRAELAGLEASGDVPPLTEAQREKSVSSAARTRAAGWAAQYYLRRVGAEYRLDARIDRGVVTVNGKQPEFLP